MSIKWPASLVGAIARRRAVILIGSGVSANAISDGGQRPPTWGKFLNDALSELGRGNHSHIRSALSRYEYLEACDYLKVAHGAYWADLLRNTFVRPQYKPAPIHTHIFNLDCRIVVSMNFDKIYETYAIPASDNTIIVKSYNDDDIRQVVAGSDRYILKPHGNIDSISNMIFTLEDYGRARVEHAAFYEIINALLHTHTLLCIGVGLSDPDMKMLFEDYRYKFRESPHYITLPSPISEQQIQLINRTRGLNVLKYSSRDGHKELTDSLEELGAKVAAERAVLAETQNW